MSVGHKGEGKESVRARMTVSAVVDGRGEQLGVGGTG